MPRERNALGPRVTEACGCLPVCEDRCGLRDVAGVPSYAASRDRGRSCDYCGRDKGTPKAGRSIEGTWQGGKTELSGTVGRKLSCCLSVRAICVRAISNSSPGTIPLPIGGNCHVVPPRCFFGECLTRWAKCRVIPFLLRAKIFQIRYFSYFR